MLDGWLEMAAGETKLTLTHTVFLIIFLSLTGQ